MISTKATDEPDAAQGHYHLRSVLQEPISIALSKGNRHRRSTKAIHQTGDQKARLSPEVKLIEPNAQIADDSKVSKDAIYCEKGGDIEVERVVRFELDIRKRKA